MLTVVLLDKETEKSEVIKAVSVDSVMLYHNLCFCSISCWPVQHLCHGNVMTCGI